MYFAFTLASPVVSYERVSTEALRIFGPVRGDGCDAPSNRTGFFISNLTVMSSFHYPPRTGFDRLVTNIIRILMASGVVALCVLIGNYLS